MFADVYKNPQKYKEAYWEVIPNVYFTGDSAKKMKMDIFGSSGAMMM